MSNFLIIISVSFLATLLSTISGTGAAVITVPTWIMLGYPFPAAQAAGKFSSALWTPVAARNYLRNQKIDYPLLFGLIAFGLVGAYLGTKMIVSIDPKLIQQTIGAIILCVVIFAMYDKRFGLESDKPKISRSFSSVLALPLGFYEGLFGSGNGIFTAIVLTKTRGFNLVLSLGYYYIISFVWCLFSSVLLLRWGYGALELILPASIGGLIGAQIGSAIGQKKGSKFVKLFLVILGGLLGLKLLLGI